MNFILLIEFGSVKLAQIKELNGLLLLKAWSREWSRSGLHSELLDLW